MIDVGHLNKQQSKKKTHLKTRSWVFQTMTNLVKKLGILIFSLANKSLTEVACIKNKVLLQSF